MKISPAGALLLLLLTIAPISARAATYHDALSLYSYNASKPPSVQFFKTKRFAECLMMHMDYSGANGEKVPAVLFEPLRASMWHPVPAVILLHGLDESTEDLVPFGHFLAATGYECLIIDEWGDAERQPASLQDALAIRRFEQTIIDVRRGIDYLQTRPHVNPHRIGVMGLSMGAIIAADAMGIDKRLAAGVFVSGGGNVGMVLKHLVAQNPGAAWTPRNVDWNGGNSTYKAIDPLTFASGVGARPVLMQNGTADQIVPAAYARALYTAISGNPNSEIDIDWFNGYSNIQPDADTDGGRTLTFGQIYPHMRMWLQINLKGDTSLPDMIPGL